MPNEDRPPPTKRALDSEERFQLLVESVRDYAIFMLDTDGVVRSWNAGAARFKGYRADEIIGQHFSRFYPPEALERGLPELELRTAAATGVFEDEGWRVRKDGSLFWANVVITAMRRADGELLGFAKVTRDLTQRRSHEEALRRSEERFRLLVEGVAEYAIFMLDVNGNVASWNVGAERIKGYTAAEIIGRHFSTFYPPEVRDSGWPQHELKTAAAEGGFVDEGWRLRKDGTKFWANVTITALRDETGRLIGFSKLTRDLSERRRAEAAELVSQRREEILDAERSARIAAQRATRIKDEFLATLSHELRTPLSAILGWTQVLTRAGDAMKPADRQRAIDVIDRNARAQVRLIDDLLDMSRVMSGKLALDLKPLSLRAVAEAAIDSATPAARAKDIHLEADFAGIGATPATVVGDAGRLQQVIWNLLSNAIKFTPRGGHVRLRLRRAGERAEVHVVDDGIGIAAHFIAQVFDRFSQQDGSSTRGFGGLGLGLAISKQLVELHGGTIDAASEGEGRGATFVVSLPLRTDEASPAPHDGEAPAPPHAASPLAGLHAVVVDDEADARELLQRVLEDHGARVTSFGSAEEALAALETDPPAVIVSDVGMPRMDGLQLMRALRAREPRGAAVPALALTAFAREEDRRLALDAGYQAHLSKPFELEDLVRTVARLAGR